MTAVLTEAWLERAATALENSPTYTRVAEGFEATVLFGVDDESVAATFREDEVTVHGDPTYETWDVALRAPAETWEKLLAETPPPLYNDLIGAWLQADLTIEGDLRLAIRHLRPLKRIVAVFREVAQ